MPPLFTEQQADNFIRERHEHWYAILAAFNKSAPEIARVEMVDAIFKHCGSFDGLRNVCSYSLPHCIVVGQKYDEVIAHEMCHAFTCFINEHEPSHGSLWLALLQDVCGFTTANKFAHYRAVEHYEAAKVAEEMRQHAASGQRVKNAIGFGRLGSLSDIRRRGNQ